MKSKFIKTTINEYYSETQTKFLTVYHGTKPKFVENIKENGIENRPELYTQGWYMVSTDFESALFHANSDSKKDIVYVFEFKIPVIDSNRWEGYPYLWKAEIRTDTSSWFGLMKQIPSTFISKLHKIDYDKWLKQKSEGF
jgi:hypothetical protein